MSPEEGAPRHALAPLRGRRDTVVGETLLMVLRPISCRGFLVRPAGAYIPTSGSPAPCVQ